MFDKNEGTFKTVVLIVIRVKLEQASPSFSALRIS